LNQKRHVTGVKTIFWESLFHPKKRTVLFEAVLLLLFIGWIDYFTSVEMSLAAFYWIPVAIVTWFHRATWGYAFSIAGVAFAVGTDIAGGLAHSHPFFLCWDIATRLLSSIIFVWMLSTIKTLYAETQRATQLEVALKSSRAAYQELQAFSYVISHNLRSPLRAIEGYCHVLLEEHSSSLDAQGREYVCNLQASSYKMAALIKGLLELAEFSGGDLHPEEIDVSGLARSVAEELRLQQPARSVAFDCASGITGRADRKLLRVALEQLLGNAWKFTRRQSLPRISFGRILNAGRVVYFVQDNGVGFNMVNRDHLFSPFQSVHKAGEFEGLGMGLTIVERIVHRHGGKIWAEGAETQGATFYFTLEGQSESETETADIRQPGRWVIKP
jgi:signal transduction histidine kinase